MKFTLTMLPDGSGILSTPDDLSPEEARALLGQWDVWKTTPQGMAILANCTVEHAQSVEIDLPEVAS